jgi:hypothetical protein
LKIQDLLHHRIQESNGDPAYEDLRYSGFVGSRSGGRMPVFSHMLVRTDGA